MKSSSIRWLLWIQGICIALVCALGVWWSRLVIRFSDRVTELEGGLSKAEPSHIPRMIFWETNVFLGLLVVSFFLLVWVYIRDSRRAQGLGAFFAGVTHELRTPLTSIRLQAESIADGLDAESKVHPLVTRLLDDTSRLESQVNQILELSRLEGGGRIHLDIVDLKSWLESRIEELSMSYRESVKIQAHLDPSITTLSVVADVSSLDVILRNLVQNSRQHSGRENVICNVDFSDEGKFVKLIFRDNGMSSSRAKGKLGGLFEKGPKSSGAGVGLYLVRTLMDRMGGRVTFSYTSQGFTVQMYFLAAGATDLVEGELTA